MKILRVFSLLIGLTSLAFTGYVVYEVLPFLNISSLRSEMDALVTLVAFWPYTLALTLAHPAIILDLLPLGYGRLAIHIGSVIVSFLLAKRLNRSRLEWSIVSLLFPYTSAILAFLGKSRADAILRGGPVRMIFSLNIALVGIAFWGGLGFIFGYLNGYAGGYVSTWAVNKFVSSDVGMVLGTIEGLFVGLGAGIAIVIIASLVLAFSSNMGSLGTPIYGADGGVQGWIGGPGPNLSGVGCVLVLYGAVPVALVVGAIAGANLNQGSPLNADSTGNTASLIAAMLGALGGSATGVGAGVGGWRSEKLWPGTVAGLADGAIVGYVFYQRWLEVIVFAVLGAALGTVLLGLTEWKTRD